MPTLLELIKNEPVDEKRENFEERLEIVLHKIKFMDKVNLSIIDSHGNAHLELSDFAARAGALVTTDPFNAHYIIIYEGGKQLPDLLSCAAIALNPEWPASKSRVSLLADVYDLNKVADAVDLVEDISEILHQGQFIFGAEGDKWIRFVSSK